MPHLPGTAALAALGAARCGAAYVKVGLWGSSTEDEAVAVLRAVREARRPARPWSPRAYADARAGAPAPCRRSRSPRARAPPAWPAACWTPRSRTGAGSSSGSAGGAQALVADAHAAGLEVALAGALRAEDLPAVAPPARTSPACAPRLRGRPPVGSLDPSRVRALRAACAATPLLASR